MTIDEAKEKLAKLQAKICAYSHALSTLYYDGSTVAPRKTVEGRARTTAILSEEIYQLSTGEDTVKLLEFLDENKEQLSKTEKRIVFLMLKDIRELQKIPMEEYTDYQMLAAKTYDLWHTAKEESNFSLIEENYEKMFAANKRFAKYVAPEKKPYDYMLDKFEEGLTMEKCDKFFATLREHIVPLIKKVQSKPQLDNSILHGNFSDADQEKLAYILMKTIGLDLDHVGLGTTEHPFTTSLGSHLDERITTNYKKDDFSCSLFSVVHEGGHALYDTGSDDELAYTVLDCGVSMGIHESQSRFYENILARSEAFCEYLFPILAEIFPEQMKGHNAHELYLAINRSEPSLIRTEADELTYALHVLIRYEIEKKIFADELKVHDIPAEWNRLYKEYLGVDVPDDKHGVLQDMHWSDGNIGYFPSYALGSAYGAQYLRKMKETVDVDGCLRKGDFAPINAWLRERIWKYGKSLTPAEVFENAVHEEFDPTVFTSYLEEKYTKLYNL